MNKSLISAILLSIFILFIVFNLAMATMLEFDVHLEPGKTFIHPDDLNQYAMGNTPVYIGIGMQNVSSNYLGGWRMGVTVYSVPSGATVVWNDAGDDNELSGSIERLNGWQPGGYWTGQTVISGEWDGNLPDNFIHDCMICFTCVGGFPPYLPMLDRFRLHLTVPVAGSDPLTDVIQICLDYTPADWLFPDPEDFGGPYCFEFLAGLWLPPIITDPVISLSTSHDVPFNHVFHLDDVEGDMITGVVARDESDNPIGTVTFTPGVPPRTFSWTFDPPCPWVTDGLNHTVTFYIEDAVHGILAGAGANGYVTPLHVTEGGLPEILGDCDKDILVRILETKTASFSMSQYSTGGEAWSYEISHNAFGQIDFADGSLAFTPKAGDDNSDYTFTVRVTDCLDNFDECQVTFYARTSIMCGDLNNDGIINILDIVYLVNAIYKGGPGPGPLEIADTNNDGVVNILDIVKIIGFKYKSEPSLNCPVWE